MIRMLILIVVASLALIPIGKGSPIDGGSADEIEIGAGKLHTFRRIFQAGERSAIFAFAQTAPEDSGEINLSIAVYDKKGNLVAEDKAAGNAKYDFAAAFWYPPRNGEYVVEISNTSTVPAQIWVTVK